MVLGVTTLWSKYRKTRLSVDKIPTHSARISAENGFKEEQPRAKVSALESSNKKDPESSEKNTPAP